MTSLLPLPVHPHGEKMKAETKCPNCGDNVTIRDYKQSTVVCENCGQILKEEIKDRGPEWRAFDQKEEQNKSRGGPPVTETIHDKGLATLIDFKNYDSKGGKLSSERRQVAYRLRKWNKRARISNSAERNLAFSLSELERMASQLGVPRSVREIASKIYREAVDEDLIQGRSMEEMISAALYTACRRAEIPRSLNEIAEVSRVPLKKIVSGYRFMCRQLDIHLPPVDPAMFVSRFASKLNLSGETKVMARQIIRKAREENLTSGKNPTGIAIGAIYIASLKCGERRTQEEVSKVAGVTSVTVRNSYKNIAEELNLTVLKEEKYGS
ncbi:transcription initiation factor IIB [candidate division MSBL1 archaeon SCGC-AAA382N08]|uniref:Transcription initiation factor IIB n=1 Tax=candidate division MSBL1 archaeon SCGC-AAA382N08 TaxID=1698285 RepID=A0A133VPR3_9EURY|nr:transcription initiation factor IIB [candidate division MSBL1 archaeon SCGC-AAA382N08]